MTTVVCVVSWRALGTVLQGGVGVVDQLVDAEIFRFGHGIPEKITCG